MRQAGVINLFCRPDWSYRLSRVRACSADRIQTDFDQDECNTGAI